VLILHETHTVAGRHEDAFDTCLRDEWLPGVASIDGARLLAVLKQAHGSGPSYQVITLTLLRDASSYGALAAAVDGGSLHGLTLALDDLRHDVVGKLLLPLPWSPVQEVELEAVPTEPARHSPSLFMEDTVHPHEGLLERYVEESGSHYAAEMAQRQREKAALLTVEAAFRTAAGSGRRREIVLWQRIVRPDRLEMLLRSEVPERFRRPGTWMHDALALRDQWESRLLRTVSWSPLY